LPPLLDQSSRKGKMAWYSPSIDWEIRDRVAGVRGGRGGKAGVEGIEYGTDEGEGEMGMEASRWRSVLLSLSCCWSAWFAMPHDEGIRRTRDSS
jgi:hypothetical protein